MEWEGQRESENVEDDRGSTSAGGGFGRFGLGGGGTPILVHGGLGTLVVIVLVSLVFGVNPLQLLQGPQGQPGGGPPVGAPVGGQPNPQQDKLVKFVRVILA